MAYTGTRRLAVVTGGNKGIGYHIAEQLLAATPPSGKLDVIIACRNPQLGAEAAARLGAQFEPLDLASEASIAAFVGIMQQKYGQLDILVNNAATAFKAADPTPFVDQTGPTLSINYFKTAQLTDMLLPLLRASAAAGRQPRIVNVASGAGKLGKYSKALQERFMSPTLTRDNLHTLISEFASTSQMGTHEAEGWPNSNYSVSKAALIAYTKILAREEGAAMCANAICPGSCATDMSSGMGSQRPEDGARTAMVAALLPDSGPTGAFFQREEVSSWI
eukprot:NODE_11964_length_1254_cov_7.735581.p1 GENE.NODE_11964_length_1254_cov_7.735581~~NODE_11964_length_1254_cov_7.735581.p1  ORF type:complete len:277 (+),score=78.86 NODE_11964_length_1254_cov_7.735581:88-918(+)